MLSADLVLAIGDEDRVAARKAHRDRMKKLHAAILKLPVSAQNQTVNAQHAEEKLREAESLLETGDEAPAGMMGMTSMMRGMMGGRGGFGDRGMMGAGMRMGGAPQGKSARAPATKGSGGGAQASANATPGGGGIAHRQRRWLNPASEVDLEWLAWPGEWAAAERAWAEWPVEWVAEWAVGWPPWAARRRGANQRFSSRWIVSAATELALRDKNPKSKQIHSSLELPISMSFAEGTPLEDVLKYIKQATTTEKYVGIQIYVDPAGLREAAASTNSTVQIDFEGIPLKTSLRLMLKQLGLAYRVRDGLLIISSPDGVLDELMEAKQERADRRTRPKRRKTRKMTPSRNPRHNSLDHRGSFPGPLRVTALGRGQLDHERRALPPPEVTEILPPCSRTIFCETGKPETRPSRALGRGEDLEDRRDLRTRRCRRRCRLTLIRAIAVSASHVGRDRNPWRFDALGRRRSRWSRCSGPPGGCRRCRS